MLFLERCITVRKNRALCVQKMKMCCVLKSDAAAIYMKLKAMSKLIAIYL
jgi:hypothetical protein